MNLYLIGHFATDTIIRFNKKNQPTLGGSVSYCSLALSRYTNDVDLYIISTIGKSNFNKELLKPLQNNKIHLDFIKWEENKNNTNFILEYHDHTRNLTLKTRGPELKFDLFPEKQKTGPIQGIVLVPICNEISINYVEKLVEHFPDTYIGIDLQGFIRKIGDDGEVILAYDQKKIGLVHSIIKLIGDKLILKGSEEEMKILTKKENLKGAEEYFKQPQFKGINIITLGEKGSLIVRYNQKTLRIPAFKPETVLDETGAGDVYLGIFLYEFIRSDRSWTSIKECGYLASSAASFDVEKKGTHGFKNKKSVVRRVKKKQYLN
jgi:sugar/nucleoside kinase (ribokinase family)